jgi:hypothetical protein
MTPSAMQAEPLISKGSTADEDKTPVAKPPIQCIPHPSSCKGDGDCGDLLLHGFFAHGTDTIVDVCITDTDAKSHHLKDPHKVLAVQECEKKCNYLDVCLAQHQHFTPFVISTDGLIGRKAKELLKRHALGLTDKWEQPHSVVRGFVKAHMSIVIVCITHLCLRGSHLSASKMSPRFQWEDSAGLGLFLSDYN